MDVDDREQEKPPWSRVLGNRMKRNRNNDPPQTYTGGTAVQYKTVEDRRMKEKEETEVRKKRKATMLQILRKRLLRCPARAAGRTGRLRRSDKNVSERDIPGGNGYLPPIGIRRARRGGVLLEVRAEENEEEKAELLAERIKEVVKMREGAKVRCPLRRLRLKLVGLPFGARVSEIAEAMRGRGEDRRAGSGWARFGHRRPDGGAPRVLTGGAAA